MLSLHKCVAVFRVPYKLVPDSAVDGWWKPPVFTHRWKHKCYSSAHHCIWRAVCRESWMLSTAQVLWSDTADIQRRCFIHEKRDVYRELVCRGDAVQQSQWKLGAAQCLWKLTCVMYITLSTEELPARWCWESVSAGTITCISWWEKVHFQPSILTQPFHFH